MVFGMFKQSNYPSDKDQRDKILRDQAVDNPFPGRPAVATPKNPPKKLFGRNSEYNEIKNIVLSSHNIDDRPLLVIQGETGMGKSALTCKIFDEINNGLFDNEDQYLYSSYIEAYGEAQDFGLKNFYKQIMRSLEKFDTLKTIAARAIQMIGQIIKEVDENEFKENFGEWNPYETINSTIQKLNDREKSIPFIESINDMVGLFYVDIKNKWENFESSLLNVLIYSQAASKERIKALESIRTGKQFRDYAINTNAEAKDAFHTLISLLIAIKPKSAFVLIIDQLEELFETIDPKKIATKFFTLLLTLRHVPNLVIILSGNLEAYKHLTSNLVGDMPQQLEDWQKYIHISRLPPSEVTKVVHYLLDDLWTSNGLKHDFKSPFYPLSEQTIIYLYEKYERNLRRLLIGLHDIFNDIKEENVVHDLTDPISSIGKLNIINDPLRIPYNIQIDFAEYLISEDIQDKIRSSLPEKGIYYLIEILSKSQNFISDPATSRKMPNSGRRPDIYYKLGGNLFHSDERRIGIEVKCYRKGEIVSSDKVAKTLELLEQRDLDYVVWITNVELHQQTISNLSDHLKERHLRITPQTPEELAYLYWSYIFPDAMQRAPTSEEAHELLIKIGVPEVVLKEPENLIQIERERKELIQPLEVKSGDGKKPSIQVQTSLEDTIKEDTGGQPKPMSIGIDLHDRMKGYIEDTILELVKAKRSQESKGRMYSNFLEVNQYTDSQIPEAEFLEMLESITNHNENIKKTTQKMIYLNK